MKKFKVTLKSESRIFEKIRSLAEIKEVNDVPYSLALSCMNDGKEHKAGMWTVQPVTSTPGTTLTDTATATDG